MTSKATDDFWICFNRLPVEIQDLAREKFELWKADPFHPSLHFKQIVAGLWSVRINREYRALARRSNELIAWFWIGNHDDYDYFLNQMA